MSKEFLQHFILVHTDTYTGNVDSYLTGLLFGIDDDRYGAERGIAQHKELGLEGSQIDICYTHPDRDEHELPYVMYGDENLSLSFGVDSGEGITEYLIRLTQEFKDKLVGDEEDGWFTIKGFSHVIRASIVSEVREDF